MIYLSCTTFYNKLKETWLYERDLDAPSVSRKPGGKWWQHHIRGLHNLILVNIKIQLHFLSIHHTDMVQEFESSPHMRLVPAHRTQWISWLLMTWRHKKHGVELNEIQRRQSLRFIKSLKALKSYCKPLIETWLKHNSLPEYHTRTSTQPGRDEMGDTSQTTFSDIFSWMTIVVFSLKLRWNLFPRVQLTIFQHWFR